MAVPAFRRLWIAGIVSDAGDWLMFIALPLVVLQLTGSAFGTSIAFLLELVPPVLLAPLVGRLVDRLPGRAVMVTAMLAQAAALLPLLAVHDHSDLPVVYGVIVAQATFATVFEPAKNAMLPTLVGPERIVSANALVGLNNDLGRIIGGPLGGVLLAFGGLGGVVVADVATYLVAAALVASLPRRPAAHGRELAMELSVPRSGGVLRALRDPATGVPIAIVALAAVAQGIFLVLFVFFVTDVLGGDEASVGVLRGVQAVGAIAAGAALGVLGARLDVLRLTLVGVVAFAAITALTWNSSFLTHAMPLYVVLFGVIGAPAVLMGAGLTSLLQRASPDGQRGSVFAALGLGQALGQAVGLLAGGVLQEIVGTLPLMEIQAGAYAAAAILALVLLPRTAPVGAR
jgi:MFS family permease